MPKENCMDKTTYREFYDEGLNKYKPITLAVLYPELQVKIKDVCYYTTPTFVGENLFCENPTDPEFMLEAQTK